MDELIKLVTERTGLPDDKAKMAVETIVGFLKQRLPTTVAEQLNTCLTSPAGEGIAEKVKGMAQGLFKKAG